MAAACSLLLNAHAASVTNGGFEDGVFLGGTNGAMSLGVGSTAITGWTVIGGNIAWKDNDNPFGLTAFSGSKFLDLTDVYDTQPYGGIAQTLATTIGERYLLSFELGSSAQYGRPAGVQVTAGASEQLFQSAVGQTGENTWEAFSLEFVATSTSTALQLLGVGSNLYIGIDDVRVSAFAAPVPEPDTWALMLAGLAFASWVGQRRKA